MTPRLLIIALTCPLLAADTPNTNTVGNDDRSNIQGTWNVVSSVDSGRKPPPESIKDLRMVISERTITVKQGDKSLSEMTYTLDSTKTPKWIDMTYKAHGSEGTAPGIYELTKDDLKICFNENGNNRSTRFVSKANSENDVLIILKREHREQQNQPDR